MAVLDLSDDVRLALLAPCRNLLIIPGIDIEWRWVGRRVEGDSDELGKVGAGRGQVAEEVVRRPILAGQRLIPAVLANSG
jgi:hypothetical protein